MGTITFKAAAFAPGIYFYKARVTYDTGRKLTIRPGKFLVLR